MEMVRISLRQIGQALLRRPLVSLGLDRAWAFMSYVATVVGWSRTALLRCTGGDLRCRRRMTAGASTFSQERRLVLGIVVVPNRAVLASCFRRSILVSMTTLTFLTITVPESEAQDIDKFKLFTYCETMELVIENLGEGAAKIGLTRDRITNAVESRLRSARLYSKENRDQYLYINVHVVGNAFSIGVQFKKKVFDKRSGRSGYATTWEREGAGTHGQDPTYIVSIIPEYIDSFIVEYLRANEQSCSSL